MQKKKLEPTDSLKAYRKLKSEPNFGNPDFKWTIGKLNHHHLQKPERSRFHSSCCRKIGKDAPLSKTNRLTYPMYEEESSTFPLQVIIFLYSP